MAEGRILLVDTVVRILRIRTKYEQKSKAELEREKGLKNCAKGIHDFVFTPSQTELWCRFCYAYEKEALIP